MGTVDDQAALAAEALRRADLNGQIPAGAPCNGVSVAAGLQLGDQWNSGGDMPGFMSPDGQGPTTALTFADRPPSAPSTANIEDIFRNVNNPRR